MKHHMIRLCGLAFLISLAVQPATAHADFFTGEMYYSIWRDTPNNVRKVAYTYDEGKAFTFGTKTTIARVNGADGLIFAPNGDLIVGGQGDRVHLINPATHAVATVTAGGTTSFHVTLDPSGTHVWSGGIADRGGVLGKIAEIPLSPFSNGVTHSVRGDDLLITTLAFDRNGNAFYTSAGVGGFGSFGTATIDASGNFRTTRLMSNVPAAHGMTYDGYTDSLLLYGSSHITQIDPTTHAVLGDLNLSGRGLELDQGTTDAFGHVFVASNEGHLVFVDMSESRRIDTAGNFLRIPFLEANLDDVAPLSGLGSVPEPSSFVLLLTSVFPIGATLLWRRRSKR